MKATLGTLLLLALPALGQPEPQLAPPPLPQLALQPVRVADDGTLHLGDRLLSHRELYELTGRADLVARSDARASRRTWLTVSAIAGGVGLIGAGSVVLLTTPNRASAYCQSTVARFNNECEPQARLHENLGAGLIVVGLAGGTLLGSLAYWNSPQVLSRLETEELVSTWNEGTTAPPVDGAPRVDVAPMLGPGLAGLVLSARF